MIEFKNVVKSYKNKIVLSGLDLTLAKGSMNFLTGRSGAGKSTLLRLIMGMEVVDSGNIFFKSVDITNLKKSELPFLRRQIGMVFQDSNFIEDLNVIDNVALPLLISGAEPNYAHYLAEIALRKVKLSGKENANPLYMSGGEQQRVDIARAIVNNPALILADEPTGNLDPSLSLDILQLFSDLNAQGCTILIATHDLTLVEITQKNNLVLDNGKIYAK